MTTPAAMMPDDAAQQTLMANVHPPDWINPKPCGRYNLVVIGAGTAGLVCAAGAAGLGAKVALIERHFLGGDCLNTGCVPSKALIRAARAVHDARMSRQFGVTSGSALTADFAAIMQRMQGLRAAISPNDSALRFRDQLGVDVFFGSASFSGPDCIEVDGARLFFDRTALCTGARAAAPAIPGLAECGYLTNETLFDLTGLPERLAVIGSGPIGCEMAQAFARFGSKVTLIERGPHILPREDADAANLLQAAFRQEGIDLMLATQINSVSAEGEGKALALSCAGQSCQIRADAILVGIGRAPNIEGLDLDLAGISSSNRGVQVDDRLQTTNPRVYAAGDICSAYKFTHSADAQARILLANALFMGRQKVSQLVVPWCTYTDPEIAHVGLNGTQAAKQGIAVSTLTVPLAEVDRAVLDGETQGFARVHLRRGSDTILGATIVARHAGEMINTVTLAMTSKLGLGAIGKTIHPYPTQAEVMKKLADACNRTRLTPLVKRILSGWLAWRRRQ